MKRAEADSERWPSGIGFIAQMSKATELGLKAIGKLDGGLGQHGSLKNFSVIIMPMAKPIPEAKSTVVEIAPPKDAPQQ